MPLCPFVFALQASHIHQMVYLYHPTPTPVNISNSGVVWGRRRAHTACHCHMDGHEAEGTHKWLRFAKRSWETELYMRLGGWRLEETARQA